jgi:hypothetical protein
LIHIGLIILNFKFFKIFERWHFEIFISWKLVKKIRVTCTEIDLSSSSNLKCSNSVDKVHNMGLIVILHPNYKLSLLLLQLLIKYGFKSQGKLTFSVMILNNKLSQEPFYHGCRLTKLSASLNKNRLSYFLYLLFAKFSQIKPKKIEICFWFAFNHNALQNIFYVNILFCKKSQFRNWKKIYDATCLGTKIQN